MKTHTDEVGQPSCSSLKAHEGKAVPPHPPPPAAHVRRSTTRWRPSRVPSIESYCSWGGHRSGQWSVPERQFTFSLAEEINCNKLSWSPLFSPCLNLFKMGLCDLRRYAASSFSVRPASYPNNHRLGAIPIVGKYIFWHEVLTPPPFYDIFKVLPIIKPCLKTGLDSL